ncbi:hypothetical protein H072_5049 [Dactylellina haptotyla CBS 200.50]|uniref:Uncharacterized protein n=1 Tax=Dactylellina haptotyla (strain CBS 200.50) TaxID=1284197 RepID=S8C0D5_DACHA|nr:hypothetical protein H072_5049 [Dactylellina haptotyla CBS 200.50]
MPVKWTAENDHLLLLTLLETHNIKVDGDKIRAAWPQSAGEQPTARAIKERIVKIRSMAGGSPAKALAASHVNNGVKKEPSPRKKTPGRKPRQRKASIEKDDEEIISQSVTSRDTAEGTPCPSPRKKRAVNVKVEKSQQADSEASDVVELNDSEDDFIPTKAEIDDSDDYLGD